MCYQDAKEYGNELIAELKSGEISEGWVRNNLDQQWMNEHWKPEVRAMVQAAGFLAPEQPATPVEFVAAESPAMPVAV